MQTEVGEVHEPFARARSSSTMPQKRNPISCLLHPRQRLGGAPAPPLRWMDAMVADHERSTGPWEIEWMALPEPSA